MIVGEVEGVDPRVNGTISHCQQLLHVDEVFFATTLVDPAFDVVRVDDVRLGAREKKIFDASIEEKRLTAAVVAIGEITIPMFGSR